MNHINSDTEPYNIFISISIKLVRIFRPRCSFTFSGHNPQSVVKLFRRRNSTNLWMQTNCTHGEIFSSIFTSKGQNLLSQLEQIFLECNLSLRLWARFLEYIN